MHRLAFFLMLCGAAAAAKPAVGPAHGSLFVVGGGQISPEMWQEFISLAGGPDSLIVIIPTASGDPAYPSDLAQKSALFKAGAKNLKVLHTTDRNVADSPEFVELPNWWRVLTRFEDRFEM